MASNVRYQGHKSKNGHGYLYYEYSGKASDIVEDLLIAGCEIKSVEVSYPNKSGDVSKRKINAEQIDAVDGRLRGRGSWKLRARGSNAEYVIQIDGPNHKMITMASDNTARSLNWFAKAIGAELPAKPKSSPMQPRQQAMNATGYEGMPSTAQPMRGNAPQNVPPMPAQQSAVQPQQPLAQQAMSLNSPYSSNANQNASVANPSAPANIGNVSDSSKDPIDLLDTMDDKQKKKLKSHHIVIYILSVLEIFTIIPFLFGILSLKSLFQSRKAKKQQRYADAVDNIDSARLMAFCGAGALVIGVAVVILLLWLFLYRPF